jgi:hypothetical protein
MSLDEVIAQAEIRQTLVNYNIAGDLQRKEEAAVQFSEDGVLKYAGVMARGRQEILAVLKGNAATRHGVTPVVRHNLTTSSIVVKGDEATARTYFLVVTDQGPSHQGIYMDRLRKVEGRWLIAEREVTVDWQAPASGVQAQA